jgi:hypothetical protein
MQNRFIFLMAGVLVLCVSGNALADTVNITVNNPGFDLLPPGGLNLSCNGSASCVYNSGAVEGWILSGYGGQLQPGTPNIYFALDNGNPTSAFAATGGVISQTVGATVAANTVYTLQVDLGFREDGNDALGAVALLVGSTPIQATGVTPAIGHWSIFTATYSSVAADIGKTLTIQLTGTGTQSNFDNVRLTATSVGPTTQILPQLAFGGGWYTALYFTNSSSTPASFTVNFIGSDGNRLTVAAVGGSSVAVNLAARGTALIAVPNNGALVEGYVSAALPIGVTGYGVFRQSVPGVNDQEAVVPLSGTTATTSTLLFDDTNYITGVAVVNLASVSTAVSVTAYGNQGNIIGTSNIAMAANAKTAVVLRDLPGLAAVAGSLGSVDFTIPIGTLAVLGLRFNGSAFTSIPASDR